MPKEIKAKVVFNKVNKQLNISLPKKQIPKKLLKDIEENKEIRLFIGKRK